MDEPDLSLDIAEFYRNRSILITGGTGFMGKVLAEKLLRSCSGIKRIYLLIRWKHGNEPEDRLHQIFESKLFDRLKKEQPNFSKQVVCVPGNLELENLDIENKEYVELIEEVSVIFHLGAEIRFNENLKKTVNRNACGTRRVIDLAKKMRKLKAFVHVSTAYCNTHQKDIYERVYPTEYSANGVIDCLSWMSDEMVEAIRPILVSRHPNNYCYSKCLTEQLLTEEAGNLPVVIVRPTVVAATLKEPIEGWINAFQGSSIAYTNICQGYGRVTYSVTNRIDFVPVDSCINLMVASAWGISHKTDCDKLVVYNCSTNTVTSFNEEQRLKYYWRLPEMYPSLKAVRYPHVTISTNVLSYEVRNFIEHFLPAAMFDAYLYVTGKKTRMIGRYRKFRTLEKALRYFYSQEWNFHADNVGRLFQTMSDLDKQIFDFNVKNINWETFMDNFALHVREYILKEDPSTLPLAKKRIKRLYYIEMGIRFLAVGSFVCLLPNEAFNMVACWYHDISTVFLQLAMSTLSWII